MTTSTIPTLLYKSLRDKVSRSLVTCRPHRAAFFMAGAMPPEKWRNVCSFSLPLSLLCRPLLLLSALASACGAWSTCWKVMVPTTPARMLMCHKVTRKNLIDSNPLFRYYLTHTPCNFFVKPIDSDTSEEI